MGSIFSFCISLTRAAGTRIGFLVSDFHSSTLAIRGTSVSSAEPAPPPAAAFGGQWQQSLCRAGAWGSRGWVLLVPEEGLLPQCFVKRTGGQSIHLPLGNMCSGAAG